MVEHSGRHPARRPRIDRGLVLTFTSALALILLAGSGRQDPLVVWNASGSSPRGLYLVDPGNIKPGDFVIAWPPADAAGLAQLREYIGSGVPLVKTAVAGAGDRVCATGRTIRRDGKIVAVRRASDRQGRVLPWWAGCRTLAPGELLLLGRSDPNSFDGRYFGPVAADQVVGRARLLWAE